MKLIRFVFPLAVALLCLVAMIALTSCTSAKAPRYPPFRGEETETWLSYEVELPKRLPSDLLPSFEASARSFGCTTEKVGHTTDQVIGGELRHWYGITASCDD